jgi:hypothetical protein
MKLRRIMKNAGTIFVRGCQEVLGLVYACCTVVHMRQMLAMPHCNSVSWRLRKVEWQLASLAGSCPSIL